MSAPSQPSSWKIVQQCLTNEPMRSLTNPNPKTGIYQKKHTKGFDQQNEGNMGISMCTFPGPTSLIPTPSAIILIPR